MSPEEEKENTLTAPIHLPPLQDPHPYDVTPLTFQNDTPPSIHSESEGPATDDDVQYDKAWGFNDTKCLVFLRVRMNDQFIAKIAGRQVRQAWKRLAQKMRKRGYMKTSTMCEIKWKNMKRKYKEYNFRGDSNTKPWIWTNLMSEALDKTHFDFSHSSGSSSAGANITGAWPNFSPTPHSSASKSSRTVYSNSSLSATLTDKDSAHPLTNSRKRASISNLLVEEEEEDQMSVDSSHTCSDCIHRKRLRKNEDLLENTLKLMIDHTKQLEVLLIERERRELERERREEEKWNLLAKLTESLIHSVTRADDSSENSSSRNLSSSANSTTSMDS